MSYEFVQAKTRNGRAFRVIKVIDEYTHECLAIEVVRELRVDDVLEWLSDLFMRRDVPGQIRSDKGPKLTAKSVRDWLRRVGAKSPFIESGSPRENEYIMPYSG